MYAIIADGGRQYKVEEGQVIELDYREAAQGDELKFEQVLCLSDGSTVKLGKPNVAGAVVSAEVLSHEQGDKIYIQKFRRRKNFRKRTGHRQMYVKVRIKSIVGI